MLKEKVINTLNKYNMIQSGDGVVIGVSGGPDSMCLLHILHELSTERNFKIYVAHVNHMLREEAMDETKYVKDFCEKNNIDCYVKMVDINEMSNSQKIGTEQAGRIARYDFFEEVLNSTNSNKIATAHNSNDNAETILMNIFRGCGTSGLKGIEPVRDNKFIRPIIECERAEIERYCKENSLEPKIDKSNFENIYTRNKIRNILIPEIKKEFNPNIIEALNKLSEVARQENGFIQNYTENVLKEIVILNENNKVTLDLKKFNILDEVIKSRIVLNCIKIIMGTTQGIEKIHIDDIVKLCENNVGNKFLMPNKNIKISVGKGKILFEKC